ncbi:MAG: glycosyl hydrolase family 79 C-terminal domain-containing protein [Actinomycetota bacterium]|nr:glycosyl hydrolase family 79 C-terminal domain-containing protein [Actinomycetota bacterium]
MRSIPRSFFGISTEYWTLPVDEHHSRLYGRILSLIHVHGDGPVVLRIGGDSSDHTLFDPVLHDTPHWAFDITPAWIHQTGGIIRDNHLRVIIDLNFITGTPQLAAQWVQQAEREFPPGSIIGLEVGNEPDIYDHQAWVANIGTTTFDGGTLPAAISSRQYVVAYRAYARALAGVVPHVPLLAPALAELHMHRSWIRTLLGSPRPQLGAISVHEYPYSACAQPSAADYPSVAKLLSPQATAVMYATTRPIVQLARRAWLPVRVTEFNSVTCGGVEGVSNTFATALWAPNALFELVRAGVSAADLHVRVFSNNPPFIFTEHGVNARPLLYGLILYARMLGPHSSLMRTRITGPNTERALQAWAVRVGTLKLNVMLTNRGRRTVRVALHLPSSAPGVIQRLLASSPNATHGVTLDGQRLDNQAHWKHRPVTALVQPENSTYDITMPATSAAIITMPTTAATQPRTRR